MSKNIPDWIKTSDFYMSLSDEDHSLESISESFTDDDVNFDLTYEPSVEYYERVINMFTKWGVKDIPEEFLYNIKNKHLYQILTVDKYFMEAKEVLNENFLYNELYSLMIMMPQDLLMYAIVTENKSLQHIACSEIKKSDFMRIDSMQSVNIEYLVVRLHYNFSDRTIEDRRTIVSDLLNYGYFSGYGHRDDSLKYSDILTFVYEKNKGIIEPNNKETDDLEKYLNTKGIDGDHIVFKLPKVMSFMPMNFNELMIECYGYKSKENKHFFNRKILVLDGTNET